LRPDIHCYSIITSFEVLLSSFLTTEMRITAKEGRWQLVAKLGCADKSCGTRGDTRQLGCVAAAPRHEKGSLGGTKCRLLRKIMSPFKFNPVKRYRRLTWYVTSAARTCRSGLEDAYQRFPGIARRLSFPTKKIHPTPKRAASGIRLSRDKRRGVFAGGARRDTIASIRRTKERIYN